MTCVKPILLSHHPNCEQYDDDVYHISKYRLCIGCFTFYPTIVVTVVLTLLFVELTIPNLILLFFISFLFFTPIFLNVLGLTKLKFIKISSKLLIGIGVGFFVVSVLFLPLLHFLVRIVLLFEVNFFIGVIAYIRARRMQKECKQCPYEGDWDSCPGMGPIRQKLLKHGFRKHQ